MKFHLTYLLALIGLLSIFLTAAIIGRSFLWITGVLGIILVLIVRSWLGEIPEKIEKVFPVFIFVLTIITLMLWIN